METSFLLHIQRESGDQFYRGNFPLYTVEPLKTATLQGMQKWPSYGGGCLMGNLYGGTLLEVLGVLKTLKCHGFTLNQ